MTIQDLFDKYQKKKDDFNELFDQCDPNSKNHYILKKMYDEEMNRLSEIIEDIKNLNGATVKLREECFLKTQHDDMKSANWKYCSQCGLKL